MKKILLFLLFLSIPFVVSALTFTEKGVRCVSLNVFRDADDKPHADATCVTLDENGGEMNQVHVDIWPFLSATQKTQLGNIADAVENFVRTNRSIPSPSPTP